MRFKSFSRRGNDISKWKVGMQVTEIEDSDCITTLIILGP